MYDYKSTDSFSYTYSARQQEEVRNIRSRYVPREEDKMERLRRLDRSSTQKGTSISIAVGVLGTLLLGLGMCCTMVWGRLLFAPGVLIGLAGIALVSVAYPLYKKVTEKERQKLAPEILRLTEELLK